MNGKREYDRDDQMLCDFHRPNNQRYLFSLEQEALMLAVIMVGHLQCGLLKLTRYSSVETDTGADHPTTFPKLPPGFGLFHFKCITI